jgi:hydroxypyruvate reductase
LIRAALRAVDPAVLVRNAFHRSGVVRVDGGSSGPYYRAIAAGKAAGAMASAAIDLLPGRVREGLVVAPDPVDAPAPLELIVGQHPHPGAGSEAAGLRALTIARTAAGDEQLLVLLSGGASSLMAVPAHGVTLAEKRRATEVLLRAGADIHALNAVRKHLSAIKGGWLAATASVPSLTFAISDVVGDDPSVIASGPTVGDRTTFADALDVLRRFGGVDAYPPPVVEHLTAGARGACAETPKPGDPRLARSAVSVVGSRVEAMRGAADEALARGYRVVTIDTPVTGEARVAAPAHIGDALARAVSLPRPVFVVSSGETTVRVQGHGRGGRNQEFALAALSAIGGAPDRIALASLGTDGVDGPTDAAGAIVDSTTMVRAAAAGALDPRAFLDNNDAYAFFQTLGDLIHTGPTGTNVGDLQIILLA